MIAISILTFSGLFVSYKLFIAPRIWMKKYSKSTYGATTNLYKNASERIQADLRAKYKEGKDL